MEVRNNGPCTRSIYGVQSAGTISTALSNNTLGFTSVLFSIISTSFIPFSPQVKAEGPASSMGLNVTSTSSSYTTFLAQPTPDSIVHVTTGSLPPLPNPRNTLSIIRGFNLVTTAFVSRSYVRLGYVEGIVWDAYDDVNDGGDE